MSSARQISDRLGNANASITGHAERAAAATAQYLRGADTRLTNAADLLQSYSYERVLERGFAMVKGEDGDPIMSVTGATPGRGVALVFHDGAANAVIDGTGAPRPGTPKPRRAPSGASKDGGQGSLL